jgi:hypothetical protein
MDDPEMMKAATAHALQKYDYPLTQQRAVEDYVAGWKKARASAEDGLTEYEADAVARAICDHLQLRTSIGPSEIKMAHEAWAALSRIRSGGGT